MKYFICLLIYLFAYNSYANDVEAPDQSFTTTPMLAPTVRIHRPEELTCMAKNIYFEAENQSLRGKLAVGLVTLNRVVSKRFRNTICEVVWRKRRHPDTGKWVAQFSWTLDGKSDTPLNQKVWDEAMLLASALLSTESGIEDFTMGATHYHADYVNPWWSQFLRQIMVIETHIFYKRTS